MNWVAKIYEVTLNRYKDLPANVQKLLRWVIYGVIFLIFAMGTASLIKSVRDERTINGDYVEGNKITNNYSTENDDPAEIVDKGFSFYMVLAGREIHQRRNKYLLDYGESVNGNRLSLYYDHNNNLVFSLTDQYGRVKTCDIPASAYEYHENVPFFLYCDCGISPTYSFMRIRVNSINSIGKYESHTRYQFIDESFFSPNKLSSYSLVRGDGKYDREITSCFFNKYSGVFNADFYGTNRSNFFIYDMKFYTWLLKQSEIDSLYDDVKAHTYPFVQFYLRNPNIKFHDSTYDIINCDLVVRENKG